jgi:dienelactone hydrolase
MVLHAYALTVLVSLTSGVDAGPSPAKNGGTNVDPEAIGRAATAEFAKGDFAAVEARFDAAMAKAMPVAALKDVWAKLEEQGGKFQSIGVVKVKQVGNYQVVHVTCVFTNACLDLKYSVDADGKIGGFFVAPGSLPPPGGVAVDAEAVGRAVVDELSKSNFDAAEARFDSTMAKAMPVAALKDLWSKLGEQVGEFKSIERVKVVPVDNDHMALVTCAFAKARIDLKFSVTGDGYINGFFVAPAETALDWKPPTYANPKQFEEKPVQVGSSPALPGVLTLPLSKGPYPVVVFVHGSGPNDADETIGSIKVFKDLAWGLAGQGIASLRYDKRTKVAPKGVLTVQQEVIDAVQAAVTLLKARPEIDASRIIVVGHSQGAYLAPRIGKTVPGVAGLVMLAGCTRPEEELWVEQLTYLASLDPSDKKLPQIIEDTKKAKVMVEDPALKPGQMLKLPIGGTMPSDYFIDLRGYKPAEVAAALKMPMFVVQGGRDYQVTVTDFEGWKRTLKDRADVKLQLYPDLNHAMTAGKGKSMPSEYEQPTHVDEHLVHDLADWVMAQPSKAAGH